MTHDTCSVDGCDSPRRKREWCGSHYAQWYTTGEVRPFKYKWATTTECAVCGAPTGIERGLRKYCSNACQAIASRYGGAEKVPTSILCVQCGEEVSLLERGRCGKRRKADTKMCRRCRQDWGKYKATAAQLAHRDGTDCGICGLPIDMAARHPDPMRPSIDHILPRARGGTHDPSNLQLTHLRCNQIKSDRVDGAA